MHKPSSLRDYMISILIAAVLLVLFGSYLFVRRGYLFDAPPMVDALYVPNKVIALAAIAMLSLTFLIGPIVRYFDLLDNWLNYRKEIGIVGGLLALLHVIVSYSFLPLKFPQSEFDMLSWEFSAGIVGTLLLILLFIISFKKAIDCLGGKCWWFLQRRGLRLVILFVLVHVYVMKGSGWIKWVTQGGSNPMPGLGILVMVFVIWVVVVRLYESIFIFKNFGLSTKEISMDATLKTHGRIFFIGSFLALIAFYFFIFTRWT